MSFTHIFGSPMKIELIEIKAARMYSQQVSTLIVDIQIVISDLNI